MSEEVEELDSKATAPAAAAPGPDVAPEPQEGDAAPQTALTDQAPDAGTDAGSNPATDEGAAAAAATEPSPDDGQAGDPADGAADATEDSIQVDLGVTAAPLPPPPEPELPPLPEDYVPVAELPPLPEGFRRDESGKPLPLAGVESIFLTGTTVELLGLGGLGKAAGMAMAQLAKERILADIQFRGAISDFHPFKAKIVEADYDPLLVRINEDDVYGDGNNFEVAVSHAAAEEWEMIEGEGARRRELLALEAAHAAAEKKKPKSRRVIKAKPWTCLGSEVDVEEMQVRSRRDPIRVVIQRKRQEFNMSHKFTDKDAHEQWNSSLMECRPFKDPNFDMRRMEQDMGVQCVLSTRDTPVQAGVHPLSMRPKAMQYTPLDMSSEARDALLRDRHLAAFLERVRDQCEVALVQNEVINIFKDDLAVLNDEAEGVSGDRKDSIITEAQSFTHLTYSKNKVVSCIQWLPHRKGCVAVACTEAASHSERVTRAGRTANAYVLVWNFKDPIVPEYVMQSPYEVFAFQFNPTNPSLVCGGCYNGQVVVWDTASELERVGRSKAQQQGAADAALNSSLGLGSSNSGAAGGGEGGEDAANIPVIRHRFMSDTQHSHQQMVTDLQWLPGVEVTHRGKVTKHGEGSRECHFFATIAADGKLNFWDVRIDKLMKKGKKADDLLDVVWKPIHTVNIISLMGLDFGGTRFCLNQRALESGVFTAGSFDGELVHGDFIKPEGEDNPDYVKKCMQAHVGPVIAVERSPFFDDVVLTVGDWQFQVWREGGSAPLFQSGYAAEYYTAACWSPTRPGVVYLADNSGSLEVWDFLDRSHEPSIRVSLAACPIMSLSFNVLSSASTAQQAAQQVLAAGDATGVLHILELPRSLRRAVLNERKWMASWLDREGLRVTDVTARQPARTAALKAEEERKKEAEAAAAAEAAAKEAAAKDAAAAAAAGLPPPPPPDKKSKAGAGVEVDEKLEAEYLKMEHRFKVALGLVEGDARA